MDQHGTHLGAASKEIRCADCGHRFLAPAWMRSARCSACGNIQVIGAQEKTGASADMSAARSLLKTALLGPEPVVAELEPVIHRFQTPPASDRVQEILTKYQVEWQLWAMVAKNFSDPAFHSAYITHIVSRAAFDQAAERYREHRSVMALGRDGLWQAEVADLMLERIEKLANMRMKMEGGGGIILPYWLLSLPLGKGVFRVAWITLGLVLMFKLLRLV
jgi:hypothetical protein